MELLVVMAVISILSAMLLASLAAAKERARSAQCLANLRQWGIAYQMYASDFSDYLPRRGQGVQTLAEIDRAADWFNALPGYFGLPSFQNLISNNIPPAAHSSSVFICPTADRPAGTYFLPYGMNMNLCPWNLSVATKMSDVAQPSFVVALGEGPGPYASTYPSSQPYGVVARHARRVNLLFLGGAVRSFAGAYVGCGVGDPQQADVRWVTGTASDSTAHNY